MMRQYARTFALPYPAATDQGLFADIEKVLRLAPQWDVKALTPAENGGFTLLVEHDRLEHELTYALAVAAHTPGQHLRLTLTRGEERIELEARITDQGDAGSMEVLVTTTPDPVPNDLREFDLWARSMVNYLGISRSGNVFVRLWKRFVDRWWLTMSQSGKRMAFFVLLGEGLSVVFLVFILAWWKFFS